MSRMIVWASPFLPVAAAFLAYAALKRRWHPAWFLLLGQLANSTLLWVVALVIAFAYGREDLFVPFVLGMISSVFTGVFSTVKANSLAKRMGDSGLHAATARIHLSGKSRDSRQEYGDREMSRIPGGTMGWGVPESRPSELN